MYRRVLSIRVVPVLQRVRATVELAVRRSRGWLLLLMLCRNTTTSNNKSILLVVVVVVYNGNVVWII